MKKINRKSRRFGPALYKQVLKAGPQQTKKNKPNTTTKHRRQRKRRKEERKRNKVNMVRIHMPLKGSTYNAMVPTNLTKVETYVRHN